MSIIATITGFVGKIFEPAVKLIDELHDSEEEMGEIKIRMEKIRAEVKLAEIAVSERLLDLEVRLLGAQENIIVAEAKGDSWLQRNWRPMFMILFGCIISLTWLGLSSETVSERMQMRLLDIVQGGLYGYVGLRSVEKISGVFRRNKRKKTADMLSKIPHMTADIK